MSAPLKADADDLRKLADFLDGLRKLSHDTGVTIQNGPLTLGWAACPSGVEVTAREEQGVTTYIIDDRTGM